jgi:hypothetical protein
VNGCESLHTFFIIALMHSVTKAAVVKSPESFNHWLQALAVGCKAASFFSRFPLGCV